MTKDEILQGYLNIAQFGIRVYGVETASLHYFGKHASELSVVEAATIAGVTNAPTRYDP
ncbi:transglycosylase domain-containing protein [Oerskovia sp. M15]